MTSWRLSIGGGRLHASSRPPLTSEPLIGVQAVPAAEELALEVAAGAPSALRLRPCAAPDTVLTARSLFDVYSGGVAVPGVRGGFLADPTMLAPVRPLAELSGLPAPPEDLLNTPCAPTDNPLSFSDDLMSTRSPHEHPMITL